MAIKVKLEKDGFIKDGFVGYSFTTAIFNLWVPAFRLDFNTFVYFLAFFIFKEFLLDVREEYEYQEGHVKGAVNLPLREILSQKDSLPKDKDIYVYCRSGHRSADAVNFLKSLGFEKVHNIEGGFIDISFNEYHKDKGNLENSVVTNYNFD